MPKVKKLEITLDYQNLIFAPPGVGNPDEQFRVAASNDTPTINKWRETWLSNIRANHEKFGDFSEKSIGKFFGLWKYKPALCAGSGPSLKRNGEELRKRDGMGLISCLHNFHFFIDHHVDVDFWVTLDAGEITIAEVSEGGKESEEYYWEQTKGKILFAYIGSSPKLLEKWQGEIYFFNCPMPDAKLLEDIDSICKFNTLVSSGGNVLGACVYIAKAILGANPIAFVGADFSFSYDKKFHGWDSHYDKNLGRCIRIIDIFGNSVLTWGSYYGFKQFFEWLVQTVPGLYFNCSEGGTLGSYPEGNLMQVRPIDLCDFFQMYQCFKKVELGCENPKTDQRIILY